LIILVRSFDWGVVSKDYYLKAR